MTIPDFSDAPTEAEKPRRDPSEFLDWLRICELTNPQGQVMRPGKVLIVRPLEKIKDWREGAEDWRTLVVADIAVLDPIEPATDQYGMPLPGHPHGSQWRNQTVFPGLLNKAWRDKIGGTLIGVVYRGKNEKGQPPFLWRSLAQDEMQKQRGKGFMMARKEFLIPVPRDPQMSSDSWVSPSAQQPAVQADPWSQAPARQGYATGGYVSPAPQIQQEQWSQPATQQAQWNPQGPAGYPQQQPQYQYQPPVALAQPVSPPPQGAGYQYPPAQHQQLPEAWQQAGGTMPPPAGPAGGWTQGPPDPWTSAEPQQPAQQAGAPQGHPNQGMSTLEQLRAAQQVNAQGQPQAGEPPF